MGLSDLDSWTEDSGPRIWLTNVAPFLLKISQEFSGYLAISRDIKDHFQWLPQCPAQTVEVEAAAESLETKLGGHGLQLWDSTKMQGEVGYKWVCIKTYYYQC